MILRDTQRCCARMLWIHMHIFSTSSSQLAFFHPPPCSLAILLSSSDKRWSSTFFRHSLSLWISGEMSCCCFSSVLPSKFEHWQLEFHVVLFSLWQHALEQECFSLSLESSSSSCFTMIGIQIIGALPPPSSPECGSDSTSKKLLYKKTQCLVETCIYCQNV